MTSDSERLYAEALKRFGKLLDSAAAMGLREPTAMALATADADGRPSVRTMLLKDFDERGLVFFYQQPQSQGPGPGRKSSCLTVLFLAAADATGTHRGAGQADQQRGI